MELDRRSGDGIDVVLQLEEGRYAVLAWHDGTRVRRSAPVDVTRGDPYLVFLPARWIVKVADGYAVFETAAMHERGGHMTGGAVHRVDLSSGAVESRPGTWHEQKKHFRG